MFPNADLSEQDELPLIGAIWVDTPCDAVRATGHRADSLSTAVAEYLNRVINGDADESARCPLFPPKADIGRQPFDVRFVPKTDIAGLFELTKESPSRGDNHA